MWDSEKGVYMQQSATVIVTGGAQRLGLTIAIALKSKGYNPVVTYRSQRPGLATLAELGITAVHADFSNNAGVESFIEWVKSEYSSLRGIIHNASDWCAETPETDNAAVIQRMMQIHVNTPYLINLALAPLLKHTKGPADIIHMTDYVQEVGSKKHIAYAASKSALHNLTLSFSALLAPNVKVNSIAPALLMFNEDDDQVYKSKALKKSLMAICPGAEEASKAVEYLFASDYITGRCLSLDGGRHLK